MNYSKQYDLLISSRQHREKEDGVYYEHHHILPKCMGGSDDPSNMVWLTPREHYIAHLLLWKSNPNNVKLYWPLQWFYDKDGTRIPSRIIQMIKQDRQRFVNLRDYTWTKSYDHRLKMSLIGRKAHTPYNRTDHHSTLASQTVKNLYQSGKKTVVKKDNENGRFSSRVVTVDGKTYNSLSEAARAFAISPKAAYNRCKKDTWPNWVKT